MAASAESVFVKFEKVFQISEDEDFQWAACWGKCSIKLQHHQPTNTGFGQESGNVQDNKKEVHVDPRINAPIHSGPTGAIQ